MVNQKERTLERARQLVASLEAAPDPVTGDHGTSFVVVFNAVKTFITAMDGCTNGSPMILGDGDMARLFNEFLERRGKSLRVGNMILACNLPQPGDVLGSN